MDRLGLPFLGCGACGQGPTAFAKAVADATGARLRDLPPARENVRGALDG